MSYKLVAFDNLVLPTYNRESGVNAAPPLQGYIETAGGGFDSFGSGVAPASTPFPVTMRVVSSEETDAGQKAAIDALRSKIRTRGRLIRTGVADFTQHWVTARLVEVQQRTLYNSPGVQVLNFIWEASTEWVETNADVTETMTGSPYAFGVENAGNRPVRNAIITVSADDAALTAVALSTTNGTALSWTGTVAAGDSLVFDCGAKSVKNDGVNAYSGLTYDSGHTIDDWLRIAGSMDITITYTGGGSSPTATADFDDGWY